MAKKKVSEDLVTDYARAVVAGREVAGRLVRLACVRHLADLETANSKGLVWKPDEAQRVIDFFALVLCLPEETAADDDAPATAADPVDGTPFILSPWQQFVVGSLMGWHTTQGYRRFRTAYIETGKGSGKTPMCAGLLLYLLVADGQRGAQFFVAAVTREQAQIGFADCEKMVAASPHLRNLIDKKVNNLSILDTGSFIRAISSEKRGLDGKRVSGAMIDEVHEQRTPVVVNKIRKGIKGRRNALILEPTNSGFDRTSVCWNHHEYSRKVLEGTQGAAEWFAFICSLDPCEPCQASGRLFPDEECPRCDSWKVEGPHWRKPNPNIGVSIPWQYIRDLVNQALGMPSEVSDLLRFNFGIWTQGTDRAFDMGKWHQCGAIVVRPSELLGRPAFGGLDLGQNDDFAAWVRIWDVGNDVIAVKCRFWLPRAAMLKFPDRPYAEWERAGILEVTEGDTTDEAMIEAAVLEDARSSGVLEIAYDKRFAHYLALRLQGEGLTMVDTPQGFALNESNKRLQKLVVDIKLAHRSNAILTWMADNAIWRHGRNNEIRLDKVASRDKVDGISALSMAISRLIANGEPPSGSAYHDHGLLVV